MPAAVAVRPMTLADLEQAHALSHALNWPHRLQDWALLQRVAQGFVAEQGGQVIGSAFACHQGDFSSIGLVIIDPHWQGQGLGRRLMEQAVASAAPRAAILNATPEGVPLYTRMGFTAFGEVSQFQGPAQRPAWPALQASETCRDVHETDWPAVLALANAGSGLVRNAVLDALKPDIRHALVIEVDARLQAFALLRTFGRGLCLGPVIAQNTDQARHLTGRLLASVPGAFMRIDIPGDTGLADWLQSAGLSQVDRTVSMSNGRIPQPKPGVRPFAVITQALG